MGLFMVKKMKVKKDKLSLRGALTPSEDPTDVKVFDQSDKDSALSAVKTLRGYLLQLKDEIYRALDAGCENFTCFNAVDGGAHNSQLIDKPSLFLEQAYALQQFDTHGQAIENRKQSYIAAGLAISKFCDTHSGRLDADQQFLNDAGKMVGAINSAVSQLNRVEALINSGKNELVGAAIPGIQGCFQAVTDSAEESQFIKVIPNQKLIMQWLSSIVDAISTFFSAVKNVAKSKDAVDKALFQEMRSGYEPKM